MASIHLRRHHFAGYFFDMGKSLSMGEYNANKTSKSWATWHFWKAREPDEYIFRHYLSAILWSPEASKLLCRLIYEASISHDHPHCWS